uniref:Uncharacterized protein n=1 Tax=Anguilla anguilla TaxID=7936 RepID=A0A0E9WFW2_ANGAN
MLNTGKGTGRPLGGTLLPCIAVLSILSLSIDDNHTTGQVQLSRAERMRLQCYTSPTHTSHFSGRIE